MYVCVLVWCFSRVFILVLLRAAKRLSNFARYTGGSSRVGNPVSLLLIWDFTPSVVSCIKDKRKWEAYCGRRERTYSWSCAQSIKSGEFCDELNPCLTKARVSSKYSLIKSEDIWWKEHMLNLLGTHRSFCLQFSSCKTKRCF